MRAAHIILGLLDPAAAPGLGEGAGTASPRGIPNGSHLDGILGNAPKGAATRSSRCHQKITMARQTPGLITDS